VLRSEDVLGVATCSLEGERLFLDARMGKKEK